MRVARLHDSREARYIASLGEGPWLEVSDLGIRARDLPELIEHASLLHAALKHHATQSPRRGAQPQLSVLTSLACPVVRPGKILAIGRNYLDHIRETAAAVPDRPIVFAKYPSSLTGPRDPIRVDTTITQQPDYESELAVVIGRSARRVTRADALEHVFGYAVANDVSARDLQHEDLQWSRSKSLDSFCPLGPWIVTSDEIPDPQQLTIRSEVNGEERQNGTTAQMIFSVRELIEFLSQTMTLEPGDVILTGTPPGVGYARKPPVFLAPGDVVTCEVIGIGRIENPVVEDRLMGSASPLPG